jgi:hypothetical protein
VTVSLRAEWQRFAAQTLAEFEPTDFESNLGRAAFYRGALAALAVFAGRCDSPHDAFMVIAAEIDAYSLSRKIEIEPTIGDHT